MTTIRAASSAASNNHLGWIRRSRRGSSICMTQYTGGSSKATGAQWEFQKDSQIHYSMQAIHTYENKKGNSRRTDSIGAIIYAGRISKHLKGEYIRRSGGRTTRIRDSRRILGRHKKEV